ncbi:MAG: benzoyl-CoA-dihydrodiol lyase [Myxococcales bacterium]|nr:benzoyl-CoA-dihydrodiol lyase [Myxococcales bacterium]
MQIESFESHPDRYQHWKLTVDGDIATLVMDVQEGDGTEKPYILKLNSYDIFVDIELADAVERLRWEHPQVRTVVVTSGKDRIFCAGANIPMLASSDHAFKVNFCKFTNETRLAIEDASATAAQGYLCAANGVASGGGYELALACDEIVLVDDRSSAVSLPEVPLLGVLPGTGGLTRVVDKRKVRRDLADYFSSLAEGVRGQRAVDYKLVDATYKLSKFEGKVAERARAMADARLGKPDAAPVEWAPVPVEVGADGGRRYTHLDLRVDRGARTAEITITLPDDAGPTDAAAAQAQGVSWWPLATFRALNDALLHLRFNIREVGTLVMRVKGDPQVALAADAVLAGDAWFTTEARHYIRRVLKKVDVSSKTFIALAEQGSAFAGTFFELALAADRFFMLDDAEGDGVHVAPSPLNGGAYAMGNGLTRLQTRFLDDEAAVNAVLERAGELLETQKANDLGLVTFAPDDIDWDDEVRLAIEERASLSPDALTGMEANLRFAGPETLETKIFGRLSAWQNWIFQRPNAVGPEGALKAFGGPTQPVYAWERT